MFSSYPRGLFGRLRRPGSLRMPNDVWVEPCRRRWSGVERGNYYTRSEVRRITYAPHSAFVRVHVHT